MHSITSITKMLLAKYLPAAEGNGLRRQVLLHHGKHKELH